MTEGLVSVVIPTYNRAGRIGAAVASALAQDHPNLEVLVVDDGSTDGTRETLERSYGGNPKVRYLPKPNGGVSSARNLGLRESRGEFVAFLDSDDTWLPGKISLQLECLRRFPQAGMVWTDMAAVDGSGRVLHERYLRRFYDTYKYYPTTRSLFAQGFQEARISGVDAFCGDIFSPMVLGNLVHTSTVLLRRERLDRVGFFDEEDKSGSEDYPFHLKTCREGPVAYVDKVAIRYTVGQPDALTASGRMILISLAFLRNFQQSLEKDGDRISLPPAVVRARLAEAYAWAGQEHLKAGRTAEARAFLIKSLRTDPRALLSHARPLLSAMLPPRLRDALARVKRGLRGS
jgi:glycosyltransferase involved in cell wall biosynthesis